MENKYYEIGWRLNSAQRKAIKDLGYHVYATRSWDEGCGSTLEHRVIVNHETDIITNFPALDDNNPEDMANDFYEHMEKFKAENDLEITPELRAILEM